MERVNEKRKNFQWRDDIGRRQRYVADKSFKKSVERVSLWYLPPITMSPSTACSTSHHLLNKFSFEFSTDDIIKYLNHFPLHNFSLMRTSTYYSHFLYDQSYDNDMILKLTTWFLHADGKSEMWMGLESSYNITSHQPASSKGTQQ